MMNPLPVVTTLQPFNLPPSRLAAIVRTGSGFRSILAAVICATPERVNFNYAFETPRFTTEHLQRLHLSPIDGCEKFSETLQALFHPKPVETLRQVTPYDVAWAERQSAFKHSRTMPAPLKHFCPTCVDAVVDGNTRARVTRGVYLPIEHDCGVVRVYDLAGKLVKTMSRAEFETQAPANNARCESRTVAPVTFKAARSVEWRRNHSAMAKLMRLYVSVANDMREGETVDIWATVEPMLYRKAVWYLKVCRRWLTEQRMVIKGLRSEARSLDEVLSESRIFQN